jgi:hypothetical protein
MPSHADHVRRRYTDAGAQEETPSSEPHDGLKRPLYDLERYAGWLSKDHVSVAVRADVKALTAAMAGGHETSLALLTLGTNIGRLPSGGIRTMLRKALGEVRAEIGPSAVDGTAGEGS